MAMDPPTVYRPQRNIRILTAAGLFGDSISHDQLLTSSGLPRSLCHSKTQHISDAVEMARFLNMLGLELRSLADCLWIASSGGKLLGRQFCRHAQPETLIVRDVIRRGIRTPLSG